MYIVKFLSREEKKKVYTINPSMSIQVAQRVLRDLELMGITAWLEKEKE